MRISIAMATYNGAKYIQAQLESFAAQTRLPDELVVSDDRSSDETIRILESFSQTAPFEVRIISNPETLGYARNFEKAITLCDGDLIFLSDQDDVWFPEKIETVKVFFEKSSSLLALINDADITDSNLNPANLTMLGMLRKTGRLSRDNIYYVQGCATAIHAKFRSLILPIPAVCHGVSGGPGHDVWMHSMARACQARLVIEKPLQYYRRHTEAVTSFSSDNPRQQLKRSDPRPTFSRSEKILSEVEERLARLETSASKYLLGAASVPDLIREVSKERAAIRNRIDLHSANRFTRIFKAMKMWISGDYDYFLGWKSLARDLM
jgi:glycosyltransferase involved in cell wall biosynthesis